MAITGREAFLGRVRGALSKSAGVPEPDNATHLGLTDEDVSAAASAVRREMSDNADALVDAVAESAATAGWKVRRVASPEDAADVVAQICVDAGVSNVLRSDQDVFNSVPVDAALAAQGITPSVATVGQAAQDVPGLKQAAFDAEVGITGVDYAIAETGTVVLHPREGLSRLVSLAPGRHIAILNRGDVLPSLDELFTLERSDYNAGEIEGSMNLISGPSRTGDIAATIVDGIHGPFEVHLVIVG
ncbi:MAG: lactate utilization protein [Chloroflexi bacterium]|jgi:L-lactate dehydrogenase complex protein LldG|nr:lactate utilization protein [Chloroflexota bacterium]MBT4072490.1 lactate utilization protein [Chloroflexota bacterium]MBT4513950.1 lactate utilization protein [Chloroflexota bacterium]MBT5320424.1 lactate utilization protein [Chloroflexota bacterium]MBT6681650.1 lactate utilization protein [Chloroflexota bacterium]